MHFQIKQYKLLKLRDTEEKITQIISDLRNNITKSNMYVIIQKGEWQKNYAKKY